MPDIDFHMDKRDLQITLVLVPTYTFQVEISKDYTDDYYILIGWNYSIHMSNLSVRAALAKAHDFGRSWGPTWKFPSLSKESVCRKLMLMAHQGFGEVLQSWFSLGCLAVGRSL